MQSHGHTKDIVDLSYTVYWGNSFVLLHRMKNGSFQFGLGRTASIVTELSQVQHFPSTVQQEVEVWLKKNGVALATRDKKQVAMEEIASERPGTLDALADILDLKGEIYDMLLAKARDEGRLPKGEALEGGERLTQSLSESAQSGSRVYGGRVVPKGEGTREFIPDGMDEDTVRKQEEELDRVARSQAGGSEEQEVIEEEVQPEPATRRRPVPRQPTAVR